MMRLFAWFLGVAVATLFLVSACTPVTDVADRNSDRITIGITAKIRTLDPAEADNFISSNILFNTTERLYDYRTGTTELVPVLAQDFPRVSSDGLTYTIPVRTGIKFHDGSDFDAEAMAFALQRVLKINGAPAQRLNVIKSISAPRPDTLVIELKQPVSFLTRLLAFTGASAISPKSYGDKPLPNRIIGTGKYKLVSYQEGTALKLDKFPDYWGEPAQNRGIDLQIFSSSANLFNAFKIGQVDVAFQTLSPAQVQNLVRTADKQQWQIASNKGNTMLFMVMNLQQPPTDNPLVRKAIASAIDRELLAERVFQHQRSPVYSLIPSTFTSYKPTFQQYEPDQTITYLKQAGYSQQNPVQVSIWYSPRYAGNGDLVASYLKAIIEKNSRRIIQVKTERIDTTIADSLLDKGTYTYPIFLRDWVPDYLDADNFIEPLVTCDRANAQNICTAGNTAYWGSFYYNPDINQLTTAQRTTTDPQTRLQILQQIQTILAKDIPYLPLWQNREYAFGKANIRGLAIEPTQQLDYSKIYRDDRI
ncbi:MAG: ABC transporter substrate-binding protein [Pseudanabaenaceae cyanobacterium]